jgi:hypothetical protein
MCVISHTDNFIFFHISKCGGTSITEMLSNTERIKGIRDTHVNYRNTKKVFAYLNDLTFFENANKFSIVRNPFDRTVSLYRYINEHKDHHLHGTVKGFKFTEFCYYLRNLNDPTITSCYDHLCDENGQIDESIKIFKLERINSDIKELSKIINQNAVRIPHVNRSSYPFEITNESERIIEDLFRKDFETFYN